MQSVAEVFIPAVPESVQIGGRSGERVDQCITNRLMTQDIEAMVAPHYAKAETGGAGWRCEYWGKWFTSLALADAYLFTAATCERCGGKV